MTNGNCLTNGARRVIKWFTIHASKSSLPGLLLSRGRCFLRDEEDAFTAATQPSDVNMIDEPNKTPTPSVADSSRVQHKSFRLTPQSTASCSRVSVDSFRDAVVFASVQQLLALGISALLLDGGLVFYRALIACLSYWIMISVIASQRGSNLNKSDVRFARWAYFPLLAVVWVVGSRLLIR